MFNCDLCGQCCRNLNKSDVYNELHEGNGICRYLIGNICSIYEERPLLCRIDDSYEILFKESIEREIYYELNYKACNNLKNGLI